ncbi:MAG: hypothetical protein ACI9MR_003914 [Myxococcota bacterium]
MRAAARILAVLSDATPSGAVVYQPVWKDAQRLSTQADRLLAMRTLLLLATGAIMTVLLLLAPAIHAEQWLQQPLDGPSWVLMVLPILALMATMVWPRPWLLYWGFPCAHLPALLAVPQLTHPVIYTGRGGIWAIAGVAVAGLAWFAVASWPERTNVTRPDTPLPRTGSRGPHPVVALAWILVVAIMAAFTHAAFASPTIDPVTANVTLVLGTLACWYGVGRLVVGDLADTVLSPAEQRRYRSRLTLQRRPSRRRLIVTAALVVTALTLLLIVSSLR